MYKYYWYETLLPKSVCDEIYNILKQSDTELKEAEVVGQEASHVRKSVNHWVPDSSWINGFCRHYIDLANDKNFKYDIYSGFDNGKIQYSLYKPGYFYHWHTDSFFENDNCRKLSFSVQLSNYDEYKGGDLQFVDDEGKLYVAPKTQGTIIIFDSRLRHRVKKVTEGERRSLVGWVMGPRWK